VLNYAPEPAVIVQELARVLRPGGRAVIAIGNGRSPFRLWRELLVFPIVRAVKRRLAIGRLAPLRRHKAFRHRGLQRLLRAAGLELETIRLASYTLLPDPLDRVFPDAATRLGRFASRRGPIVRSLAAMQLIVAARKPAPRE
jgi:SAM-dependent methyltransferase